MSKKREREESQEFETKALKYVRELPRAKLSTYRMH